MIYVFLWILLLIWIYIWSKKIIFNNANIINNISIQNQDIYINNEIKSTIQDYLSGKNYYIAKINIWWLKTRLHNKWINIVDKIGISKDNKIVKVNISYISPTIVLSMNQKTRGYHSWYFFQIDSSQNISSWNIIINVNMFSWDDISSIFFETKPEALIQQVNNIYSKIQVKNNFWIPAAQKIWITNNDGKIVYFDIKKNIFDQIQKYNFIKDSYIRYDSIKELDLWTIDDSVFIK